MKDSYSKIAVTAGITLTLIALSSKATPTHSEGPSLQVVSATLVASPAVYDGPCPTTIKFSGSITVTGKGQVRYTFVRSDGATAPVYTMGFDREETKSVNTTWTLNLPTFGEWQAIKILSPNELQSDRAAFKGTCQKAPNNSPTIARTNSLALSAAEPTQTAKGQFIACPLKESRTEVTTSLPEPWWNTPQIGSLERTSVQTIGGNRTLVCEYSAYGRTVNVMRLFPEGASDCAAEGNGFQCH